ncbi:hypothetical protein MLD38_031351 [Melastoma candidum]|uniref:Uncharacterized protein n=1 Tax=Melastoma candidum TaxID=119954 RepID=A0ACB9MNT4_9MYRT|nr:hypothetical protein MLD38_031351 [Melastoma candidum]
MSTRVFQALLRKSRHFDPPSRPHFHPPTRAFSDPPPLASSPSDLGSLDVWKCLRGDSGGISSFSAKGFRNFEGFSGNAGRIVFGGCKGRTFGENGDGIRRFSVKGLECGNRCNGNAGRVVFGGRFGGFSGSRSGTRSFSSNRGFGKRVFEKPAESVRSAFGRYREAIGLQVESFLRRNYLVLVGAGGVLVCIILWRIMFAIANSFVGISEGLAKYGFLALSSAIVAFTGLYIRSRFTINPDRVYRMAMRTLNTHAGTLEVMGAPLAGTELRAYVMSGGGVTLKKFKPRIRGKRCFLIFPIRGSERRGLVSVEVKKKNGQHDMKLLAIDIPMSTGPDQRLFLIGDEEEYKIGGGLISELRDPVLKAMAATKEFDVLDEIEEEEDAERELQEAERKHQEEVEKLEKAGRE